MKRFILIVACVLMASVSFAQNTRLVKGVVFDHDDIPMAGATISVAGMSETVESGVNGNFEIFVSPYAKRVTVKAEGYLSQSAEIDGSYIVFNLKLDKEYAKRKAAEEEAARVAAEQAKAAEQARLAAEKAKAAEEARLAAEKAAAEEKARIAAEQAKAKEEERARLAAEREAAAQARAEERARIAAEREVEAQAKAEERAHLAAEREANSVVRTHKSQENVKRFASIVNLGYVADGFYNPLSLGYIGGMQLNSWFFGVGAEYHHGSFSQARIDEWSRDVVDYFGANEASVDTDSYENLTLQLYAKKEFGYGAIKPFAALSLGSHIFGFTEFLVWYTYETPFKNHAVHSEYEGGIFATPEVGVNYSLNDKMSINFSVGYRIDYGSAYGESSGVVGYDIITTLEQRAGNGLTFHLGITF